jgi:hypothetical protein
MPLAGIDMRSSARCRAMPLESGCGETMRRTSSKASGWVVIANGSEWLIVESGVSVASGPTYEND